MRALLAYHRARGYGRASVTDIEVREQAAELAFVEVRWRVFRGDESLLWSWSNGYNLVAYDDVWRILVQFNLARMQAPLGDPRMADFVARLEPLNQLADRSPGFVWRLQTKEGDATAIRAFPDLQLLVNMSVWESLEALRAYVYESDHVQVIRDARKWFDPVDGPSLVLWWIPTGELPTLEEAKRRLELLRESGPCRDAFTFTAPQPSPG